MNRFMWDPTDERLFERTRPDESSSSYTVQSLSDDDLLLAVDQFLIFSKEGKWPVDDNIVNRIWEKHKSELGDNPFSGRYRAYDLICHEVAKRWHLSKSKK